MGDGSQSRTGVGRFGYVPLDNACGKSLPGSGLLVMGDADRTIVVVRSVIVVMKGYREDGKQ